MEKLKKALDERLEKARYLKRTGTSGNYKYIYKEGEGPKRKKEEGPKRKVKSNKEASSSHEKKSLEAIKSLDNIKSKISPKLSDGDLNEIQRLLNEIHRASRSRNIQMRLEVAATDKGKDKFSNVTNTIDAIKSNISTLKNVSPDKIHYGHVGDMNQINK